MSPSDSPRQDDELRLGVVAAGRFHLAVDGRSLCGRVMADELDLKLRIGGFAGIEPGRGRRKGGVIDPERCDKCRIRLAPADPCGLADDGPRCSACVRAYGPAELIPRQLELELETGSEQPLFGGAGCKEPGCTRPVVGSSITGTGHACARHNTIEWGRALAANPDRYYRQLGQDLLRDAGARPCAHARPKVKSPTRPSC